MRVGWLRQQPQYIGGAELTAQEFKDAAPEGVEVVEMPPGAVGPADTYVAHNIPFHTLDDLHKTRGKPLVKYVHDAMPIAEPGVTEWVLAQAKLIFCSELHLRKFPHDVPNGGRIIPPALNPADFKAPRQSEKRREGTCSIAQWRGPGKGAHLLDEWAIENGPVDVYGDGGFHPRGHVRLRGKLEPDKVAQTLWEYERFVFLPLDFEPFCRTVAEAHFAGTRVVTNSLVGAREYLNSPDVLENTAEDFWRVVLNA